MTDAARASRSTLLVERLLRSGRIDEARLRRGREIAEGAGLPLCRALLFMRLVSPADLAASFSEVLGKPLFDLDAARLPPGPPGLSEELCRALRVLTLAVEPGDGGERVVLAMSDPTDRAAGERVAAALGKDVRPVLVDDAALSRAIARRYDRDEQTPAGETAVLLVDLASLDLDVVVEEPATDPGGPPVLDHASDDEGVFTDRGAPLVEATTRMRRPREAADRVDETIRAPRPDVFGAAARDAPDDGVTAVSSAFADLRVCFVSADRGARDFVARELSALVGRVDVAESLVDALQLLSERPCDDVVVHAPRNDAPTGLLMERLSRLCDDGLVVLSDDEGFAGMPCVRARLACPVDLDALPAAVLEGLFTTIRGAA